MITKNIPVLIKPVFISHLWGGALLKDKLNKRYPQNDVGESWEISAHEKGHTIIASGKYKNMTFSDYYTSVLGNKCNYPLLIKLIGPKMELSVQVHPDDTYAKIHENSLGKKEAWYILSAPEDSYIIAGVNCTKDEFSQAIKNGNVKDALVNLPCKAGDVISIEPGMVHALMQDIIVYEVQQNSDITYRIYDWDRIDKKTNKPRDLHINKALDVIDFSQKAKVIKSSNKIYECLLENEYFSLAKICIDGEYIDKSNSSGAYTLIKGAIDIIVDDKIEFQVSMGDSFYAPNCKNFIIKGKGELLKSCEKQLLANETNGKL